MNISQLEKTGIFEKLSYDAAKAAVFIVQRKQQLDIDMDDRNKLILEIAKEVNWYFCERHLRDTYELATDMLPENCV